MPNILMDRMVDFGKTHDGTPWVKHETFLGDHSIAESIVEWSKKHDVGSSVERHTAWGLTLVAIAKGETPSIALRLNEKKLHEFLSKFGPTTVFCIQEYGITMTGPMNPVKEAVAGKNATATIFIGDDDIILHRFNPQGELKESILLGTVTLSEEGFKFYTVEELQAALAVEEAQTAPPESSSEEPITDKWLQSLAQNEETDEDILLCQTCF